MVFGLKLGKKLDRPRGPDGTFAASTPAPGIDKMVSREGDALLGTMKVMDSIYGIMEKQNAIIDAKVESILASGYEPEGPESDGLLAQLLPILEGLAPHIGPQLGRLLDKYSGVQPPGAVIATAPVATAPGGIDPVKLIKDAAGTDPKLLKLVWPAIQVKLKEAGIEPETFKQAIANINKAI